MKKLSFVLVFLVGCASAPQAAKPGDYASKANATVLADTVARGPKDAQEDAIFEKIDRLFMGTPGYRSYKEDIGKHVIPPKLLHMERAAYPAWAHGSGISAKVTLAILLDKDGGIQESRILDTTDARFNDAATSAIKKWRFSGGSSNDDPDSFVMVIPFEFHP